MDNFKKYRRIQIAEMRPVTGAEIKSFRVNGILMSPDNVRISISEADLKNNSPKPGDMIARNPENHADLWLVAAAYFRDNFEEIE